MSHRNLVFAILTIALVAVCVAKNNHGKAKGADGTASAKFNPLGMVMNMMNPTTKAPSSFMLSITKAATTAINTIDYAANKINGLIDRAKDAQSMIKTATQETIDGVVDRATNTARKQGGEPGCVTEALGRAGSLAMQLTMNELQCPGNKIETLEDMAETIVTSGQTLLDMVPKAALSLDQCERKGGPLEIICTGKIVADMTGQAVSVGLNATNVVAKAVTMASTIAPSMATCAGLKVGSVAGNAVDLVSKFGMCSGKAMMGMFG